MATSSALPSLQPDQVFSQRALWLAWERVRQNNGCAGVDERTLEDWGLSLAANLDDLRLRILAGMYHPHPLKRFWLPKDGPGLRPIGVPTVEDRIAQQAVAQALGPVLEAQFGDCSFAYRPGRSWLQALDRVCSWRDKGRRVVIDADIDGFFDHVDHELLLGRLARTIDSPPVVDLVEAWVRCPVAEGDLIVQRTAGVPQGAVVSPLLANLYLDVFDKAVLARNPALVRYADDFVLLCGTREDAEADLCMVEEQLAGLRLQLEWSKTRITDFATGFRYLGAQFSGDRCVGPERPTTYGAGPSRATTETPLPSVPSADRFVPLWERELLPLSALAALIYCPRAFIYGEVWREEVHSAAVVDGVLADMVATRKPPPGLCPPDSSLHRTVPVVAPELGVQGVLDAVIEKWGTMIPVEYKYSPAHRLYPGFRVQLAAGAMALEEAWGTATGYGYVYFLPVGPRKAVELTGELRDEVRQTVVRARGLLRAGVLPAREITGKCHACSYAPLCRPFETAALQRRLATSIGVPWTG